MSRIGKQPVKLPAWVTADLTATHVHLKGAKGTLSFNILAGVQVQKVEDTLVVSVENDQDKQQRAFWGLTRAMLQNMAVWVSDGYVKTLEIQGVGYRSEVTGTKITLAVGFSHKVTLDIPAGVTLVQDAQNANILHISGIDAQQVGEFAGKIRAVKTPEPYKGKGIRYVGEYVRRKAGKTGAKA